MMLTSLIKKKNVTVIGINSGTSADGVDLAAIKVNSFAGREGVKFLLGTTFSYPQKLKLAIDDAMNNRLKTDDLIILDRQLGNFYGRKAARFTEQLKKKKVKVDLVVSHGQTVRHLPGRVILGRKKESATLQLGHPESIAEYCSLPVVADFRQADIGAGGEGAPITSHAMWKLFGSKKENRLLLNIGGISNYFLFPKGGSASNIMARDCGPGNSLIDLAAERLFKKKYDRGGALARKGEPSLRLISILLSDNFLKGKYGPSTGKERFGEAFYMKAIRAARKLRLNKHDIIATLSELTGIAILNALNPVLKKHDLKDIYLFGGGAANRYLFGVLQANLPEYKLDTAAVLGYDPDYVEAICYAIMGVMTIREEKTILPHVTGARRAAVAGRVIPGY